jgi:hypothetical protein
MRIKFQADADLDGRIVRGLRRVSPEVDIRTAAEAGLATLEDYRFCAWPLRPTESSSAKTAVQCRVTFNVLFLRPRVPA